MPISTRRLTEIRLLISDLLQRGDWEKLFVDCGTGDLELARSIANIFGMFDPAHVWKFIDYVGKLPREKRKERRDSTLVTCLTIGRVGQVNPSKALKYLRLFLSDDHMLRQPVEASLSNLWVFDQRETQREIFNSWILGRDTNDDLQEIGVLSSAYLLSKEPKAVEPFLIRVLMLKNSAYAAAKNAAKSLAEEYRMLSRIESRSINRKKEPSTVHRPQSLFLGHRKRGIGKRRHILKHMATKKKKKRK
jgi:hypothetical protein